jgi:hypothetical protein
MAQTLDDTVALLTNTPAALQGLLHGLPDRWTQRHEGDGTMTVRDVVGHLVEAERTDFMPRIQHILEHGDSEPFPPFDRWAHQRESAGQSIGELLDRFAQLRARNLAELRAMNLQAPDFERPGRHPALGSVKLSQLLATWAAHDLTHLHQISRILAHQSREDVGPWSKFLGVLRCQGHSD